VSSLHGIDHLRRQVYRNASEVSQKECIKLQSQISRRLPLVLFRNCSGGTDVEREKEDRRISNLQ
jgi:hypothetical protein